MRVFISLAVILALFSFFALPAQAQFGGLTNDLKQKAEQAIVDQVTKQVGESLGQGAPLLLDQHTALEAAPALIDFHPKFFQPTAQDLNRRLPPGDYAVPVMGFCTQYSIHAPGRGLGYKLARVQGKQAEAISALLVQGSLHGISPYTLNADAWRIQAGVPLSQWSAEDQALIHSLIPRHEKELQGDFLQQLHATYDSKSTIKLLGMKKRIPGLPSFEAVIAMMGDTGKTIMKLEASRQILTDRTISAERLPDALFEPQGDGLPRVLPPSADPSPSPWAEVQPGVFARYTILDGNMGRNLYEFRITPAASQQGGLASGPVRSITLAEFTLTGFAPTGFAPTGFAPTGFAPTGFVPTGFVPNAAGPTLGAITGMGDASGSGAALNIGYSIGQGAQALIAVPILTAPSTITPAPGAPGQVIATTPIPPASSPDEPKAGEPAPGTPKSEVVLTQATTTDAESVTVSYAVELADATQPIQFNVYRSANPTVTNSSQDTDQQKLIGTQTVSDASCLSKGNHNVKLLSGTELPPNTAKPYVVVVATSSEVTENTTYFRKRLLGVISHGFDLYTKIGDNRIPPWEVEMAFGLEKIDGYDDVLQFDWEDTCTVPKPGMAVQAGLRLAEEMKEKMAIFPHHAGDVVDIHLIGHSRGAVVVSVAAKHFIVAADHFKGSYIELTLLDPHPANNSCGECASVQTNSRGKKTDLAITDWEHVYEFQSKAVDPRIELPKGVKKIDIWYQHSPTTGLDFPESLVNLWGVVGSTAILNKSQLYGTHFSQVDWTDHKECGHKEVHKVYETTFVDTKRLNCE